MKKLSAILLFVFYAGLAWSEEASPTSSVTLDNVLSKLKLKGRAAFGYLDSGAYGSYSSGSFEVPDAKLAFQFDPDDKLGLTMRFNLNNATVQTPLLDYLFVQSKDFLKPVKKSSYWDISGRLGRFKLGFGEENWDNNSIEGALPSNSAGDVGALDEGLELSGKFWLVSISNGTRGVVTDSSQSKAWMGKLFYTFFKDALYVSASAYDSGQLKASSSELSISGLSAPTTGTVQWLRRAGEVDARYDYKKGKKPLNPTVMSDSKAVIKASLGRFKDSATQGIDRHGYFGFVEALWNFTKPFYVAGRASFVDLASNQTATLNGVTGNYYRRYSFGGGYRWSENTIFKLGYDFNVNGGAGTRDTNDDLLSALVGVRF